MHLKTLFYTGFDGLGGLTGYLGLLVLSRFLWFGWKVNNQCPNRKASFKLGYYHFSAFIDLP